MSHLRLQLLAPPTFYKDGEAVPIDRRKGIALVAFLAVTDEPQTRDTLATIFWPEFERKAALAYLRRAVWSIRQSAAGETLIANRRTLSFDHSVVEMDVLQFCDLVQQSDDPAALREAIALYHTDFLNGFTLADCPAFDTWQTLEQERLRQAFLEAHDQLGEHLLASQDWNVATQYTRACLLHEPTHEPAHQRMIRIFLATNRRREAVAQLDLCRNLLRSELGNVPSPETLALLSDVVELPPPTKQKPDRLAQSTLPLLPHAIIGRKADLAAIKNALADSHTPLLTLCGLGGVGKTLLALAVARSISTHYPDGVRYVDLSSVVANTTLISALIVALDLDLHGKTAPREQLHTALRGLNCLLVLDNFEHLITQANELSAIWQAAPTVQMLVTSRERLGLREERVYEVRGLPVPVGDEHAAASDLFLARADQIQHNYTPDRHERQAIGDICRLVEGNPLAIELAAGWTRVLTATDLLSELRQRLDVFADPHRPTDSRHASLLTVLDHTWQQLDEAERACLGQLAGFQGAFPLTAATTVTQAALRTFLALTDKFLIQRTQDGRHRLNKVWQRYLRETHGATPDDNHSRYFLTLLQEQSPNLFGTNPRASAEVFDTYWDDLQVALDWAVTHSQLTTIHHCVPLLSEYLDLRGRYQDAERLLQSLLFRLAKGGESAELDRLLAWIAAHTAYHQARNGNYTSAKSQLETVVEQMKGVGSAELTFAQWQLGYLAYLMGDFAQAQIHLRDCLERLMARGDIIGLAQAHNTLGLAQAATGEYELARCSFETSIAYSDRAGYTRYRALTTHNLGNIHCILGDLTKGQALFEQTRQFAQRIGDRYGEGNVLLSLAEVALIRGEIATARERYAQCYESFKGGSYSYGLALAQLGLGQVLLRDGETGEARTHLQSCYQTVQHTGSRPLLLELYAVLAELFLQTDRPNWAATFAHTVIEDTASSQSAREQAEQSLAKVREQLSEDEVGMAVGESAETLLSTFAIP